MKESAYNIWLHRHDRWYVYNGISGALAGLTSDERSFLLARLDGPGDDQETAPEGSDELLADLRAAKVLLPDDFDELELLAGRYAGGAADRRHLALTLVTSLGCNFDCPYCFEAKFPSLMSDDVQRALCSVVDDRMAEAQSMSVCWFGGEPLLGKSALLALSDRFLDTCARLGRDYSASIITNGYLLDERTCQELAVRHVRHAQITLDGPPDVHDRMRPTTGGRGTFDRILSNLVNAVNHFAVSVRVNVDAENIDRAVELLPILEANGLAGKCGIHIGHLTGITENPDAPSGSYSPRLLGRAEFARETVRFNRAARARGFMTSALPRPTAAPCTAIRTNDLVVGSEGELYKCYESIGNADEVVGSILDVARTTGREQKWLAYTPFDNDECRSCIALPVCMGGCANHAMDRQLYENRCGVFRHSYLDQIADHVDVSVGAPVAAPEPAADTRRPGRRLLPVVQVSGRG